MSENSRVHLKRNKLIYVFGALDLGLCAIIMILWGTSLRWCIRYDDIGRTDYYFTCFDGCIYWQSYPSMPKLRTFESLLGSQPLLFPNPKLHPWPSFSRLGLVTPRWSTKGSVPTVRIPFWLPLVMAAGVFLGLCKSNKRAEPNSCEDCHYDLTGNISGICPECGTPIPKETQEKLAAEPSKQ